MKAVNPMKNNSGLTAEQKYMHLGMLASYRDNILRKKPELRNLFIELTDRCNEHCLHCGSVCGDRFVSDMLTADEIRNFLDGIKRDFPLNRLMLCVTGGEPLLRPDFFEIMNYANALGFGWGMTTNGTLITPEVARRLRLAGMKTVSVSVDGLGKTHDEFRQSEGSFEKTVAGVENLIREGGFEHIQVTTVVHRKNIGELDAMYEKMLSLGIRSWRVINVEPIGRAKNNSDIILTDDDMRYMFSFIREHRFENSMEVCYGCSHYLGVETEREVRPWYFLCNSGVYTASVTAGGDIVGCLDIERRPELVQGNIRRDNFKDVWENGFGIFRGDARRTGKCRDCEHYVFCAGGAFHTWNFDRNEPDVCLKGILFD